MYARILEAFFMRSTLLTSGARRNESGIMNLDDATGLDIR